MTHTALVALILGTAIVTACQPHRALERPAHTQATPVSASGTGAVHGLAQRLIEGGAEMAAPAGGQDAPIADLLQRLPDAWDESRELALGADGLAAIAHRSGRDWFIGVTSHDGSPRQLQLDLDFLPAADYQASVWLDGDPAQPIVRRQVRIDADHRSLLLDLAGHGGAVIHLVPPSPRIADRGAGEVHWSRFPAHPRQG